MHSMLFTQFMTENIYRYLPVDVVEVYGYDSDPNSPTFGQFTYFDQGVTLWTTKISLSKHTGDWN